jgi:hypothetical protein
VLFYPHSSFENIFWAIAVDEAVSRFFPSLNFDFLVFLVEGIKGNVHGLYSWFIVRAPFYRVHAQISVLFVQSQDFNAKTRYFYFFEKSLAKKGEFGQNSCRSLRFMRSFVFKIRWGWFPGKGPRSESSPALFVYSKEAFESFE